MGSTLGAEKSAATKLGIPHKVWRLLRDIGLKWCYCCEKWHHSDEFGIGSSSCHDCRTHKTTASVYRISVKEARSLRSGTRVCELCGRQRKLEVDHDHKTGKVRGMLCNRCNGGLGRFLDDVDMLAKAILYLKRSM